MDAEYRYVSNQVQQVLSDVDEFRKWCKRHDVMTQHDETLAPTARVILVLLELEDGDVNAPSDLQHDPKLIDPQLSDSDDYKRLMSVLEKHKRFTRLYKRTRHLLNDCITQHVTKYWVSFHEEAEEVSLTPTEEYESEITNMNRTFEENRAKSESTFEMYDRHTSPNFIATYLENVTSYQACDQCMIQTCAVIMNTCDVIRQWQRLDKKYAPLLWDVIQNMNRDKRDLMEENKKLQHRRQQVLQTLTKRDAGREKVSAKMAEVKLELRKLKQRVESLLDRQLSSQDELDAKDAELERVNEDIKYRKSNSPKYFDKLWERKTLLEQQLARVEERLNMLERQNNRFSMQQVELEQQLVTLQDEADTIGSSVSDGKYRLHIVDTDLADVTSRLKLQQDSTRVAKKIRDLKLDPVTLRKIFYQRLDASTKGKI